MKLTILASILCTLLIVDKSFKEPFYNEIDTLAAIIHSECGNCPLPDLYLTGSVVINRANHPDFPNSIRAVVRQDNQFSGYKSRQYFPTKKTRKVADDLYNGIYLTPNLLFFCTYDSYRTMDTVIVYGKSHLYGI
jgi:hypothetical protein